MKKRNRMKSLYWLIPIVVAVLYLTVGVKAGIVQNSTSTQTGQDSISFGFDLLDSLGNPVIVDSAQDWGCMITYYPGGLVAVVDSFLLDGTTNAQVRWNAAYFRGLQSWNYRRQISDLDGTPVNGTYSYRFIVRDSSLHLFTTYRGEFTLYQTAEFATVMDQIKYDTDSLVFGATLDNPSFLSPTTASRTLDVSATGEAGVDWANVGSPTSTVGLSNTTVGLVTTTTTATNLTNAPTNGDLTATMKTSVSTAVWNATTNSYGTAGTYGNLVETDSGRILAISGYTDDIGAAGAGLTAITTPLTTIAGYTDDIGTAGAGLTAIPLNLSIATGTLGRTDFDSTYWNGIQDSVWLADSSVYRVTAKMGSAASNTGAAAGGITEAQMADMIDSMFTPIDSAYFNAIADSVWQNQLRTLTALDEDNTTIDLNNSRILSLMELDEDNTTIDINGTTLGTVTTATNAGGWNSTTTDSVLQAIDYTNNARPVLRGSSAGDFVDVTATGEVGIDLDNTAGTLAKTTDITGFNDIAATAIVSSGAITTSGGAVSTVTTTGTVTNMVTANVTQISGDGTAADNLETMLDGTGGQTLTLEGLHITATSGPGMTITGASGQFGAQIVGGTNGSGLQVSSGASTGYGLVVSGNDGDIVAELTTGNFGTGAITENDIANGALRFGQEIDTVGDESGVKTEATTGGGGATAADIWAYGTRTLTSGSVSGTSTSWIALVDAPGTTANRQFVIDSTALGGANETGLTNIAIMVRDADAGKYTQRGIIERVNCVADNCTLQVAEAFLFDFEAGDSVFMKWDEPNYVIATLAEAAAVNKDTLLGADTTGHGGDGTIAGAIVAEKADTAKTKTMLDNYGLGIGLDSLAKMAQTGTAAGLPRTGAIITARAAADTAMQVFNRDSLIVRSGRVTYVDTTNYADTLGSQVASSSEGSGGCPDSVGYAVTLVAYDSLAIEPVQSAQMALRSTVNGIDLAVSSLTGVSGAYTFTIATPGTYYVITRAAGMTFPVRTLVVSGAQTDTVNGAGYTVSGHAVVVGSVDCIWCDVRFVLESSGQPVTDTSTGLLVTQTVVDTTTNSFGDFTMGLPKTGNMVYMSGTVRKHPQWRVKVSPTDVEKEVKWEKPFDIPADSTTINLRYVR